jgi:K+-transporting ATPase ATPase A chain
MMLFPMALVLMYGRDAGQAEARLGDLLGNDDLMVGTVVWSIYYDTYQPNPVLRAPRGA